MKILFVCVENSNRSQMAEAFAHIHTPQHVEAYSAGSRPSGKVNPKAIEAMSKIDYDMAAHRSKSLDEIPEGPYEYVISMGCGEDCPHIPAKVREDWLIPDPKHLSEKEFGIIRDYIGIKVRELLQKLV